MYRIEKKNIECIYWVSIPKTLLQMYNKMKIDFLLFQENRESTSTVQVQTKAVFFYNDLNGFFSILYNIQKKKKNYSSIHSILKSIVSFIPICLQIFVYIYSWKSISATQQFYIKIIIIIITHRLYNIPINYIVFRS